MEQFEQNLSSEDSSRDVGESTLFEVAQHPEDWYGAEIKRIQKNMTDLEGYASAKKHEPKIAAVLSDIMSTRPRQPIREEDLLRELKKYEYVISFFENKYGKSMTTEEVRKQIDTLWKKLKTIKAVEKASEERPEQN